MPVTFSMQQLVECYIDPLGSRFKEGYQNTLGAFLFGSVGNVPAIQDTQVDPWVEKNVPSWRILWTAEPGKLQSMGSQRVRHD